MNIIAKLTQLLPLQKGIGKNGQWRKQDIIVETDNRYPKKICMSIWGDNIIEKQLVIGNVLDISYELESREYNGKWYSDIKALKISVVETEPIKNEMGSNAFNTDSNEINDDDGLPF